AKKRTDSIQNPDPAKKRTDSVQNPSIQQTREASFSDQQFGKTPQKQDNQSVFLKSQPDFLIVPEKKQVNSSEAEYPMELRDKKSLSEKNQQGAQNETIFWERPLAHPHSLVQSPLTLFEASNNVKQENQEILGIWYKEVPFWFWAVFAAGYVLATFLAGILFALLLNLNQ
ncbi:MAG: hypothetical protein Q4C95_10345, partial [Planctomycetia bacterium]|nr:hypothetical protein [Planctomycetia bacterium]